MIQKAFGQRLKQLRIQKNLTQEQLSFASRLTKNYISDVERGQRNVSLQAIEKIAQGLGVSLEELFKTL